MSNADAICVLKKNFCIIESMLHSLSTNKKSVEHWLTSVKSMEDCGDYEEPACCKPCAKKC
jgi:hypothetical protein